MEVKARVIQKVNERPKTASKITTPSKKVAKVDNYFKQNIISNSAQKEQPRYKSNQRESNF